MKDQISVYVLIFALIFLAFRLYQRYFKKDSDKSGTVKKPGTSFPASSKDDDYEPYSNK